MKWNEILFPVEVKLSPGMKRGNNEARSKQRKSPHRPILPRQFAMTSDQLQHELNSTEKHHKLNPREQVGSYALEILSSNPLKRSTMGMVVLGDRLEIWYFDRLGCLGSETLALNQGAHFELFVQAMALIITSSAETLGFEPSFKYGASWPHSLNICTLQIPVGESDATGELAIAAIASDAPLHLSRCLSGRGTSVLPVRLGPSLDTSVMKIGWQVSTRMSEAHFYELAAGVEGLPDIVCSGTVVRSLREGVRGLLEEVLPPKPDRILPVDRSLRVLIMTERYYPLTEAIDSKSLFHDPKVLLDVMKSLLSG